MNPPERDLYTDGASRGNPGNAGAGAILIGPGGDIEAALKKSLGVCTNNEAEYKALILGLEEALRMKNRRLRIFLDSELIVRQLQGVYRIKNSRLSGLAAEARNLLSFLDGYTIEHIPRERNAMADRLANEAIDEALGKSEK
ncbi:MAG: ribonuclease HI family protein [Syntrophales bacterium]|nr:ribonuclease HI family protein [Syntrophales bacterium]MDD5233656.1 ribonuclease HI family protein [Syntrophales bacterium]MDD5532191.1 ribonuclease HI family protein [Syntrophales bacterium]HPL63924.1 ribonuclease HI family protein [Syntrophales bacterium]